MKCFDLQFFLLERVVFSPVISSDWSKGISSLLLRNQTNSKTKKKQQNSITATYTKSKRSCEKKMKKPFDECIYKHKEYTYLDIVVILRPYKMYTNKIYYKCVWRTGRKIEYDTKTKSNNSNNKTIRTLQTS